MTLITEVCCLWPRCRPWRLTGVCALLSVTLVVLPPSVPVFLTNFTATLESNQTVTVAFSVQGGTNGLPYSLYRTDGLQPAAWSWLGPVMTTNHYSFSNQPLAQAFFTVAPSPLTLVVAWGDDALGQTEVPLGLSNVVAVAAGYDHSLALRSDGTVAAWGAPGSPAGSVPADLPSVRAVAAGWNHVVALMADATVRAWGDDTAPLEWGLTDVPAGLSNAVAIAANSLHSLALRSEGTVVAWGYGPDGEASVPSGLSNVVAMAAGGQHNLAVKSDGTVVAWGVTNAGQCDVPAALHNARAVAAGWDHSLALRSDGTVLAWGGNAQGQATVPAGLSNVVAIAAGGGVLNGTNSAYSLALKSDGTLVVWGGGSALNLSAATVEGVLNLGAGVSHTVAVCAGRWTPLLVTQPASQYQVAGGAVSFTARAFSLAPLSYQWQRNGVAIPGATNATLTLTGIGATQQGNYSVLISTSAGSLTSSNATLALLPPPLITAFSQPSNQFVPYLNQWTLSATATAPDPARFPLSYQWQLNGTNLPGATASQYTFVADASTAGTYSLSVSNAAGSTNLAWQVYVQLPGSVWGWGSDAEGESEAPVLTNVAGLAAGEYHSVALKDDGTVAQWGYNWGPPPPNLDHVVAVAAGYSHSLALRGNGTVVAWGDPSAEANYVPTNLPPVKAVAAGWNHNVALLADGRVTAWGIDGAVLGWHLTEVPPDLTNVTAIAANALHSLALRADGTVEAWGYSPNGETNVPAGLSNVVALAAGESHNLALKSDGTVVAWGLTTSNQCGVSAGLSNVLAVAAGAAHSVALKNDGTLVTWGDNSAGQTNAPPLSRLELIAAGGNHSLAAVGSSVVQYPVTAAQDLLLLYNANSLNSSNVCAYYLQHRPGASAANVLSVRCANSEAIAMTPFTNQVIVPLAQWLTAHPTKRPQYLVTFLDLPSQVCDDTSGVVRASSSYLLAKSIPGFAPCVTCINLSTTNDCFAYIDKLQQMAAVTPPPLGGLLLCASAGGYGNTNYYFDDTRRFDVLSPPVPSFAAAARSGVLAVNPAASIIYSNAVDFVTNSVFLTHITSGSNVAGYLSFGANGGSLANKYATNGYVRWSGQSAWWIMETIESFNGLRDNSGSFQGFFLQWFAANAFGGTNYSNIPVGAVSHIAEPSSGGVNNSATYFGLWAGGKAFAICAWASNRTPFCQAVGDPLVRR
jgi:alpha-tubulin suppressor-like RCC1 family protein